MKLTKSLAILTALTMGAPAAFAADAQSKNKTVVKAKDVKAKKENNIDDEITNARMRAESGSKSKYSLSTSMNYYGGSVVNGFGVLRPNLSAGNGLLHSTSLSGSFSIRARLSKNVSMTLGTGLSMTQPLAGVEEEFEAPNGKTADRYAMSDPRVGISYVGKVGDFQTSTGFNAYYLTSSAAKAYDMQSMYAFSQTVLTSIGETGIQAGLSFAIDWTAYHDYGSAQENGLEDYSYGFYPFAEYSLSDKYSLRTVFGYFKYFHTVNDDNTDLVSMHRDKLYQSVGLGMSITRDIYLYPNVQFLPEEMHATKTNVAISATINML